MTRTKRLQTWVGAGDNMKNITYYEKLILKAPRGLIVRHTSITPTLLVLLCLLLLLPFNKSSSSSKPVWDVARKDDWRGISFPSFSIIILHFFKSHTYTYLFDLFDFFSFRFFSFLFFSFLFFSFLFFLFVLINCFVVKSEETWALNSQILNSIVDLPWTTLGLTAVYSYPFYFILTLFTLPSWPLTTLPFALLSLLFRSSFSH